MLYIDELVLEMKNKGLVVDKKKRDYVNLHRWSTRKRKRKKKSDVGRLN